MTQGTDPPGRTDATPETTRTPVGLTGVALGSAALLFLWYIGDAFLVIFAGVLLAAGLDAAASGLGRIVAVPRSWRLAIVLIVFAALLGGFLSFGSMIAVRELADLLATVEQELQRWRGILADAGLGRFVGEGDLAPLLPDPSGVLSHATTAVTGIFGVLGSAVLVVMLGVFFCFSPGTYRDGVVRLLPSGKRRRMVQVLDEAGGALRWWLVGVAINMAVIALFMTVGLTLIGLPHALALGFQAGLLAFIPTIGPLIAALPIMLVSLSEGYATVLWALGLYAAVQMLESNVLTPLVQMELVALYPGTILVAQLIMLSLFGPVGLALATPLAAVGKVLVQRLYVEDILGERHEGR